MKHLVIFFCAYIPHSNVETNNQKAPAQHKSIYVTIPESEIIIVNTSLKANVYIPESEIIIRHIQ